MNALMDYKNIIAYVFVIIQATCISGCADMLFAGAVVSSTSTSEKNIGAIQVTPAPTFDNSKSVIILSRQDEFAQHLVNYKIAQNDKIIGLLKPGSYLEWETEPGVITISYRAKINKTCYANKGPCISKTEDVLESDDRYPLRESSFIVKEGEHTYLRFVPDWFLFTDVPRDADIKTAKDIDLSTLMPPVLVEISQK